MRYFLAIFTLFVFVSCATTKPEGEAYKYIKDLQRNDRYSLAATEIFKFEAAYPKSKYMCELWEMHITYYTERDSNEGYVKKVKKKYKEKCKN